MEREMTAGVDRGRRDWSELNHDLLQLIAGTITEISDQFRFRSVCKSWRSAAKYLIPPRQGPWALLVSRSHEEDCHVISPFDDWRRFSLRTPYAVRMKSSSYIYGSPYGFFLVIDRATGSLSTANPIAPGSWFPLPVPPLPVDHDELPPFLLEDEEFPPLPMEDEEELFVTAAKIIKTDEPKLNFIVSLGEMGRPFLWRPGDSTWTQMYQNWVCVFDYLLYKGNFYLVESSMRTVVLDSTSLAKTCEFEHPYIEDEEGYEFVRYYLVESSSGELLMVAWDYLYNLWIFQLDFSEELPKWVTVKNIGDDTLFLYHDGLMCFPTGQTDCFATNCVYFFPVYGTEKQVVIWGIEDDAMEFLPYDVGNQNPVWIIPNRL